MEKEFLINAGPLRSCIASLKPFISTEETRYYLNGIYFELAEESRTLNMVATDGIKLCVLNVDVDRQELFDFGELKVIVPTKVLDTMLAMLKGIGSEFPIALRFNEAETKMFVDTPDEKGEFKLIEGTYPDYRKVIPTKKPKFSIGFGKVQAKEALKAIASHVDKDGKDGLEWEMTDKTSPLVIRAAHKLVVVMPMRVSLPGETIGLDPVPPVDEEESEE
jgi:DNA polymerase III sliding clamp (beta) subunit (PCNA family)